MVSNCGAREDSWEFLNCKEIKPVNPKGINPDHSLEELMLKLQYFGYLKQRVDSLEKLWCWRRLRTGRERGEGWDGWMASLIQWKWVWANSGRQWRTGKPGMLQSLVAKSWTWLSHWTTTTQGLLYFIGRWVREVKIKDQNDKKVLESFRIDISY